ncbi:MAG TPA: radical SAM protein [Deltaproteobacteria bacterium]|nr:radical SAM protein [Deltaproteobacteria bacterium]
MDPAAILADRRRFVALARRWTAPVRLQLGDVRAVPPSLLRLIHKVGARPAVELRGLPPDRLVPTLIELSGRRVDVLLHAPWAPTGLQVIDDHGLGELLFHALRHAETHQDRALRAALDAHRGYRRILAGAPRDPGDPLDLRWDLTHAPIETPRLTFLLTRNCQLRCSYCTVQLWDEDGALDDQLRGLQVLFAGRAQAVRMQFYGGEPLLQADRVRLLVERARELARQTGKELSIVLITNGLAVDAEIARFCWLHDVEVLLSLDGPAQITNRWRRPHARPLAGIPRADADTWGAATRALRLLQQAGARVQVILTVAPSGVGDTADGLAHVLGLGVRAVQICYAMGLRWGEAATEALCDQLDRIVDRHGEALSDGSVTWVNLWRSEPLLIDTALQLETDGRICFMNQCIFERHRPGRNYGIAHVRELQSLQRVGATRFHSYALLTATYSDHDPRHREIMLDNLRVGEAVRTRLTERLGVLPTAGEA